MARTYVKRDLAHWEGRKNIPPAAAPIQINTVAAKPAVQSRPFPEITYGETEARGAVPASSAVQRGVGTNNGLSDPSGFENIRAMSLSYASFGDNRAYYGIRDAVDLCMRAYAGVASIRNAIEIAVEFSCQPLYIKTSNDTVKTFFTEWFHAIGMPKLLEEFMRERYRSGNVFLYKFSGKFGPAYYKHFQQSFGAANNRIPIRYTLLNPASVFVPTGLTFPYTYTRLLSIYEIERLRHPMTEQDKQVFNDLPQFVKDQIKVTTAYPQGIYIPMEPERLRFSFYKKQSYEPLATPMCWPVLPAVEWKLTLMKMDKALARTIEHAILLVTTGETGTEFNGGNGINPTNITRLQNLFSNQTIGRVLVADYTTEAEWLIPPLEDLLGPQKYEVVNQDILDGLQSIMGGGKDAEKFANAQTKVKIFIQRLKEGQEAFLNDFLMPEIIQICDDMGFRTVPKVGFRAIDLQDDTVVARIYTQLAQLGILTGKQTVKAIETGILPDADEMDDAQVQYVKDRNTGQYLPLVGASLQDDAAEQPGATSGGPVGRPAGPGMKMPNRKSGKIGTKANEAFSIKAYVDNLKASQTLTQTVGAAMMKRAKVEQLNPAQIKIVHSLADIIMATEPRAKWDDAVAAVIKSPSKVPDEVAKELEELAAEYDIDNRDAILLRLSRAKTLPVV